MQNQLPLWPEEENSQELNIWDSLDPTTQKMIITLLSRLITQAASPKPQEVSHER